MVTLLKHQRSQAQSDCRVWLSPLALVMTLFVLPYIADVPYLDDHASTHDAEENFKVDRKAEPKHDEIVQILADGQHDCVGGHGLTPQEVYKRVSSPPRGTPSFQRIFHPSLISKPPPIA